MSIKIVFPEGGGAKCGFGTKVLTDQGQEIIGITAIDISIRPDTIITARLEIEVSEIENLEGIEGVVILQDDAEGSPGGN